MLQAFRFNVDGKPFESEFSAAPQNLLHAAAIATYYWAEPELLKANSVVRIDSHDLFEGGGEVTVDSALKWALSPEGRALLEAEACRPLHALTVIAERLAIPID
jgi:hypothetical protein